MKNAEKEELIFEFWNTFKGEQTSSKTCPKTGTLIRWHSHNKLTHDMRLAMRDNFKDYSIEDMCIAISNYREVLIRDDTFWTHVWPLSTFFSVKYTNAKDSRMKWWRFLPENFDVKTFLKSRVTQEEKIIEDPNPDLTNKIISSLQKWGLCRKEFVPNNKQLGQIRLTTQRMMEFYKNRVCKDAGIWLEDLYDCLQDNYLGKGERVSIGLLCSDYLWDILMPQLLRGCGDA